jgi:pimeloyl-ACP methyl ester carboxylesterase
MSWERVQTLELDGHRWAYRRLGSGPPVVLLHGITTASFIWRQVALLLAEDHEVIAPDLLGCGESDKPRGVSFALRDHASRVLSLLQALELGPVQLVGHDLGGGISQLVAARRPSALRTLTLVNSVAFDHWPVSPITLMRTPIVRTMLMASFDVGTLRLIVGRGLFHPEALTPELLAEFRAPLATPEGRQAFLHFARCLDHQDLLAIRDQLAHLTVPTLVVRGDADRYLPARSAEALAATIPASRLVRTPSGGHFVQVDEPGWLTEQLRAHFARQS